MKKIDIVSIAFGNFKRRKTRSILTVLGVVIGTASIVTMMSLGIAMNVNFNKSIEDMGDLTTINVYSGYDSKGGKEVKLTDELIAQIEQLEDVTAVSPQLRLNGKLVAGKYVSHARIVGIKIDLADKLGFKFDQGNVFTDTSSGKNVYCFIGSEVPYEFYNPRANRGGNFGYMGGEMMSENGEEREPPPVDLMDENTRLKFTFDWSYGEPNMGNTGEIKKKPVLYNLKPSGILKQEYSEKASSVFIDMDTAKRLKKEQDKMNAGEEGQSKTKKEEFQYSEIKVLTKSLDKTLKVTEEIKQFGLEAWSNADWIVESQKQAKMIQMVLGGIGSVSLLVAAIGITNTMIMSIYERTREIGIMKVIGCYLKDIRTMFLFEAGFIGFFGGVVGVGLSYGLSAVLNYFGGKAGGGGMMGMGGMDQKLSVIPIWLALLAVVFAILVGLISGFFPARRAMRLSALEAMRN